MTKAMEDFILYKTFPSGGTVSLMTGLDKTSSDYNDLLSIACCFAHTGKNVNEYESYVRPWAKRKTSNMIINGLRQSDRIILDNRENVSSRWLSRSIRARLKINAPIKEVWAFDGFDVVRLHP